MKVTLVLLGLLAFAFALPEQHYQDLFTNWIQQHQKIYSNDEFQARYQAFKNNVDFVNTHNADPTKTFKVSLNVFADLSINEFNRLYKGLGPIAIPEPALDVPVNVNIPASVNWVTQGDVTAVKNQGQCGSCWSFSTTGSFESACKIQTTGGLVSLSEQQLVDCSGSYGNQGCNGGLMDNAFKYIKATGGLDTESSYPYTAKNGACHVVANSFGPCTVSGYTDVASRNEDALANAIALQPVSVAIDASHSSFQLYHSGIYYEPACSQTNLDHGVLAAGYGDGYYLVKNSWGASWGNAGYIQMSRGRSNNCGIATAASYPATTRRA
jgi:cathepsin L